LLSHPRDKIADGNELKISEKISKLLHLFEGNRAKDNEAKKPAVKNNYAIKK